MIPVELVGEGWQIKGGDIPFDPQQPVTDTVARALYARQMKISHKAIVAALGVETAPPAFESHPLLRDMKPLRLVNGCVEMGNLIVRLDPVLGLVLETPDTVFSPVTAEEE